MQDDDLDLVRAALGREGRGGDDGAFHMLIDRHAGALFRVAMSMSKNRADAEDLMQETMIGAYRSLKNFAGRSSVKTWLMQIMTRQAAKSWHRTRHHRKTASLTPADGQERQDDAGLTTRDSTAQVQQRMDVMQVMQALSPSHREILTLREIRGLSYDEIASVLEVPRGTVESRLSRARAEFREKYEAANGSLE